MAAVSDAGASDSGSPVKKLILVGGDYRLSSWSLRPWFFLRNSGVKFDYIRILLDKPDTHAKILTFNPAGKVPALLDDDLLVWESLAICEYSNEKLELAGWPSDLRARAVARSMVSEMHSGFSAMRREMSMNTKLQLAEPPALSTEALADIERIKTLWINTLTKYEKDGPWLFGKFSICDAFFAPVVLRFKSYAIPVDSVVKAYMDSVLATEAMTEWLANAAQEES